MLLKLSGPGVRPIGATSTDVFIGRISENPSLPEQLRRREILRVRQPMDDLPTGFRAYLFDQPPQSLAQALRDAFVLGIDWQYLTEGDVVRIDPRRRALTALYRRSSPSNSLLVTERCDNFCLMCSQPPKAHDDSWLVDELAEVIPLISPDTPELGITGGEPALLGERLVALIDQMKQLLPRTAVHVLSNGRRFSDPGLTKSLAALRHPDLMIGIPVYSDISEEHDYIVQARGAFEETIRGILNLKQARVRVELRFVVHAESYARMADLATFITRNLRFLDHVALMGLELTGFAKTNIDRLWIDPLDYREQLMATVQILSRAGLRTSIYNHQLCVLPTELHPFARKSISDWKNRYFDECATCVSKPECGGFFASANLRISRGISAIE